MSDVTQILQRLETGDGKAAEELLPLVRSSGGVGKSNRIGLVAKRA